MDYKEELLTIDCDASLVGILTLPVESAPRRNRTAVILLNAGIVHRVGPNRIHVLMARRFARQGWLVCRFDLSGIGDSTVSSASVGFDDRAPGEVKAVMDHLQEAHGIRRFVLAGICSGADVALQCALLDERVVGCGLINGRLVDKEIAMTIRDQLNAKNQGRYFVGHLGSPRSWFRALTFQSAYAKWWQGLKVLVRSRWTGQGKDIDRGEASAWMGELTARGVSVYLIYAGGSSALDLYNSLFKAEVTRLGRAGQPIRAEEVEADHTFTLSWAQHALVDSLVRWLGEGVADGEPAVAAAGSTA